MSQSPNALAECINCCPSLDAFDKLFQWVQNEDADAHAHTHANTHADMNAHANAHTHTIIGNYFMPTTGDEYMDERLKIAIKMFAQRCLSDDKEVSTLRFWIEKDLMNALFFDPQTVDNIFK